MKIRLTGFVTNLFHVGVNLADNPVGSTVLIIINLDDNNIGQIHGVDTFKSKTLPQTDH